MKENKFNKRAIRLQTRPDTVDNNK